MENNNNLFNSDFADPTLSKSDKNNVVGTSSERAQISRACSVCDRRKTNCNANLKNSCTACHQNSQEYALSNVSKKRGPTKGFVENLESRLDRIEHALSNINHDIDEEEIIRKSRKISNNTTQHESSFEYKSDGTTPYTNQIQLNNENIIQDNQKEPLTVERDVRIERAIENINFDIHKSISLYLIHMYFISNHPTLPVVEKRDLIDVLQDKSASRPATLLVYAICTYTCFLMNSSDDIFKRAKTERDSVFTTLMKRVKVLARAEYLKPHIATIQSFVLLCALPNNSTSTCRNWIMSGMAIRMAEDLNMHRISKNSSKQDQEKNKRVWYSVYATDRWCCAFMGRPLAIADSDCDVDLPSVEDNNFKDLVLFVNFIKLSGILGEVLRRIYSPKVRAQGYQNKAIEQTVYGLHRLLEEWLKDVPNDYKLTEQDLASIKESSTTPSNYSKKVAEGGPLTICYHAVVLLLHRPFLALEHENNLPSMPKIVELCRLSAKQSIDIARLVSNIDTIKFGWNFAVFSIYQAALVHVFNSTSQDFEVAKEAQDYFKICINYCLGPIANDVPSSPPVVHFLQTLYNLTLKENQNSSNRRLQQPAPPSIGQDSNIYNIISDEFLQAGPFINIPPLNPNVNHINSSDRPISQFDNQLWISNDTEENVPIFSQYNWQQLFSSAGPPFPSNLNPNYNF